jgi:hypothetical protein
MDRRRWTPRDGSKLLGFGAGLVVGGFLFRRFLTVGVYGPVGLTLPQLSYQGALLLGGVALGAVSAPAWLWGPLGMSVAPVLILFVLLGVSPTPESLDFALFALVIASPAPLIGGALGVLLRRQRVPGVVYVALLAGTLVADQVVPRILRGSEAAARSRRAAQEISTLLRRIHEAELSYQRDRADRTFTCDGTALPGFSELRWHSLGPRKGNDNNPTMVFAESIGATRTTAANYAFLLAGTLVADEVIQSSIQVILACPAEVGPNRFRAYAYPTFLPSSLFSIDEIGTLTVSEESNAPLDPERSRANQP